jgi:hypothetical protein
LTQEPSTHAARPAHEQLCRRTATLACTGSTVVMLACAWWFVLREPLPSFSPPDPEVIRKARGGDSMAPMAKMRGRPAPEGTRKKLLEAGAELPSLGAQGWLNGPPPIADDLAGHLVVLDVWDDL